MFHVGLDLSRKQVANFGSIWFICGLGGPSVEMVENGDDTNPNIFGLLRSGEQDASVQEAASDSTHRVPQFFVRVADNDPLGGALFGQARTTADGTPPSRSRAKPAIAFLPRPERRDKSSPFLEAGRSGASRCLKWPVTPEVAGSSPVAPATRRVPESRTGALIAHGAA